MKLSDEKSYFDWTTLSYHVGRTDIELVEAHTFNGLPVRDSYARIMNTIDGKRYQDFGSLNANFNLEGEGMREKRFGDRKKTFGIWKGGVLIAEDKNISEFKLREKKLTTS